MQLLLNIAQGDFMWDFYVPHKETYENYHL